MKKLSVAAIRFRFPDISRLLLLGLYTLTFYLAPVLSLSSKPEEVKYSSSGNHHFINAFDNYFEFGDY
ncbi:MAG: hypothetical protein IID52_00175 [Proteobacteria bacterium]|nr:hypothetical protein [Pseudomonadota bacterium]